jgi:hypothetical protein
VDVTTHLKARAAQAVGLLALVVGGIAVAPGVALAAQPNVSVDRTSPSNVLSGGKVTVTYHVTAGLGGGGGDQNGDSITVKFNLPSGVQCGDCGQQVTLQPTKSQTFAAHLTMPQVGAGQNQTFTVTITATSSNDQSNPASTTTQVTVQGPDKPQSVRAITGKVKDTSGKGVAGARVGAQDSAGKTFSSTTTGNGSFSILATDSNPIAPGSIQVGAGKDGYADGAVVSVQGSAGKTVSVNLTLKALQATTSPSASATPSASAGASLDPGSVLDTDAPAGPAVNLPSDSTTKKTSNDSSSGSMLFVVLGGLLVAAGVGAIVLVLMRRRNATKAGGGPDGGDPTAMGGGPGVVPPSQGRFNDATRVGGAPAGGFGGPAAATMVAPRSGAPSMSDAPTMLHRPVPAAEDEFPDPYGVPLPQPGSYAGTPAGSWDDQGANQYGGAPAQYGQGGDDYAAGTGPYGGGAGQYAGGAPQQRFDEHTSLYQPESEPDGYGGYDQGGYGANGAGTGTYGGGAAPAGGAPGAGEYGAGAGGQYGGGAYGGGQEDDYRAGGGYQAGGGYGQEPAEQGGYGSWGAPAGGIDSGNGYGPQSGAQGAPSAPAAPGGGQYGGGAYGGAGAANGGGTYGAGQYGGAAGGGYDDRAGYDQGYDQQQPGAGGAYGAGGEYGRGNGAAPPQPGTPGYDQYEEDKNGYGGRRGYEDDPQQPTPRRGGGGGGGRRPGGY